MDQFFEDEDNGKAEDLVEALVSEIKRVENEVIPVYEEVGAPGAFALAMIKNEIEHAKRLLFGDDVITMIGALHSLRDIQL